MPIVDYRRHHVAGWLMAGLLVLCIASIGLFIVTLRAHQRVTKQQQLQAQLTSDANGVDFQTTENVATQLINGQKAGTYKINNETLAVVYLDRASARVNLKQYSAAMQDYQTSIKLDNSDVKEAALQGEVSAGYRAGQRRQLIPLLQQLVTISSAKGADPLGGTPQQYEQYIHAIQTNEPVDL